MSNSAVALDVEPDLETQVRSIIAEVFAVNIEKVNAIDANQENFTALLGANSIDALELLITSEERFGIEFGDTELAPDVVVTISGLVTALRAKIEGVT